MSKIIMENRKICRARGNFLGKILFSFLNLSTVKKISKPSKYPFTVSNILVFDDNFFPMSDK